MTQLLMPEEVALRPLPDDMLALLHTSPDLVLIEPGADPVLLQVTGPDEEVSLVLFRSSNGVIHVAARDR